MKYDIDILELIGRNTTLKRVAHVSSRGVEFAGPCPFCGGDDRLRVQPDMGMWWCRQCSDTEHWSDAPNYVMRRDNVDFKTALSTLGLAEKRDEPIAWDYHDAQGELIYQVVRFVKQGEKNYFQRIPHHTKPGEWVNGLNGTKPTIYRLPEVLRAAEMGETIYITEGEKCADALRKLGLVATTNSGGAGRWRGEYSKYLEGAGAVIVLADNDEVGAKHADEVLRATRSIVPVIRTVDFPDLAPHGDVADWLKTHTKAQLIDYCAFPTQEVISADQAPAHVTPALRGLTPPMDFHTLLALPRQDIVWYAPGFFREGLAVLAGEANIGKTPLVVQLALAIATGTMWMNKVLCKKAKVLFIGTEYTRTELAHVIESSAAGVKPEPGMLAFKCLDDGDEIAPGTPAESLAMLEHYIATEGYQVIIIDVMTGYLPEEPFKQNVYRGDYKELKPYHVLMLKHHAMLIGTWHSVKRETNPRYMYNGSSGLWAVPASRVTLYTDQEQRVRIFSMPRFCPKTDWALAQAQTLQGRRWVVSDAAPEPLMSDNEKAIWRFLKSHATKATPLTPSTIAEMTSLPIGSVKVTVRRMYEKNLIQQSAGSSGYFVEQSASDDVTDVTDVTLVTPVTNVTAPVTSNVTHSLTHQDALNGTQKSMGYMGYNISQEANVTGDVTGLVTVVSLDSIPPDDITSTMPADWQSTPEDVVITYDPSISARPWLVVMKSTGRRLAAERTQPDAEATARYYRGA
jgi:hypothetical protein